MCSSHLPCLSRQCLVGPYCYVQQRVAAAAAVMVVLVASKKFAEYTHSPSPMLLLLLLLDQSVAHKNLVSILNIELSEKKNEPPKIEHPFCNNSLFITLFFLAAIVLWQFRFLLVDELFHLSFWPYIIRELNKRLCVSTTLPLPAPNRPLNTDL